MEPWIESELDEGRPIPAPTGAAGLAGSLRYEDGDAADHAGGVRGIGCASTDDRVHPSPSRCPLHTLPP